MSRGLGPTQHRALAVVGAADAGLSVIALATLLGVPVRRCRKVVASLEQRGELVVAVDAQLGRTVWLPVHRQVWLAEQRQEEQRREYVAIVLESIHWPKPSKGITCPNCGYWLQTRP